MNFHKSFSDFQETFSRGNEVVFSFQGTNYFIIPHWSEKKIIGCDVGIAYSNTSITLPIEKLGEFIVAGHYLKDVFNQITILENNF